MGRMRKVSAENTICLWIKVRIHDLPAGSGRGDLMRPKGNASIGMMRINQFIAKVGRRYCKIFQSDEPILKFGKNSIEPGVNLLLRDTEEIMAYMDSWVSSHPWAKGGWVDSARITEDYVAIFGKDAVENTAVKSPHPIQQVRDEITELVSEIMKRDQTDKIVEVGMGIVGGSHRLWTKIFKKVVTIELVPETVERFICEEILDRKQSIFIIGDSRNPKVIQQAVLAGSGCDVLFIDGDHTYEGVEADFRNYVDLAKPSGLVVFHDTQLDGLPNIQVKSFVDDLASGKITGEPIKMHHIRMSRCVGISFYEKSAA
jgi:cephalosporin hydroxylase